MNEIGGKRKKECNILEARWVNEVWRKNYTTLSNMAEKLTNMKTEH